MDFQMKQWRNQQYESEEQHISAKIPKLHSNTNPHHEKPELTSHHDSALPLFSPKINLSSTSSSSSFKPPRIMGSGYFSVAQWQELELQALIFRYMVAGEAVPAELLQPIKKSLTNLLINTPHYFLQPYHHQHALFETGYWGRAAMDPEPGRCRRTDGKKWRCSRDVVASQKYCERHVHRGRNRSRKPVESGTRFALPAKIPGDPSRSSSDLKPVSERNGETKSDGHHVLRPFFDDWPRSRLDSDNDTSATTTTSLSISTPGNPSSDVSLKLSTGDGDGDGPMGDRARGRSGWAAAGWAAASGPMGGPLAEALRSSTTNSNSSPTSVLHRLSRPVPFGS